MSGEGTLYLLEKTCKIIYLNFWVLFIHGSKTFV